MIGSGFSTEIYEWVWFSIHVCFENLSRMSGPKSIGRGPPPPGCAFNDAKPWLPVFGQYFSCEMPVLHPSLHVISSTTDVMRSR
jgi:hypothetical protein